jgi:orotidine-5'-phosphate decarboxylase
VNTGPEHFADRLTASVRARGNPLCVGLDPRWDQLPIAIRRKHGGESLDDVAAAYEAFCLRVLEIVAPLVAAVKPQSAFYEACGPAGMRTLKNVLAAAGRLGLVTVLDGKRNDIASTAEAYADAAFGGTVIDGVTHPVWDADALTVNPYLGRDALEPFIRSARRSSRGVFVLVRTSNAGSGMFQELRYDGKPLYQHVGLAVQGWGRENLGRSGYGDVGAVVGATHPGELKELRRCLPNVLFLIPGFGAQGGRADDVAGAFDAAGQGAVVNSARGITASFSPDDPNWESAVERATREAIASLRAVIPRT